MSENDGTTRELISAIANTVLAHAPELTELDRVIGDADHGVNLERGFRAVLERIDIIAEMPLGRALNELGMTLIRFVGGASGPLYGKLFATVGKQLEGRPPSKDTVIAACEEAIKVLKALGHSDVGQKTMLDVLVPALEELQGSEGLGALQKVSRRAKTAALATVPMIARRGRAAFLNERSQGHMDPGARSSELILTAACRYLETRLRAGPIKF